MERRLETSASQQTRHGHATNAVTNLDVRARLGRAAESNLDARSPLASLDRQPYFREDVPRKQHVLHITQYLHPGGLERMIWKLSEELRRQGHEAEIFVYDQADERTLQPEIEDAGILVHAHLKKAGLSWSTVFQLRKLIRSGRYTAIHSHDLGALIYASLANVGPGSVRHVHTQHSFIHFRKGAKYSWYEKVFARRADCLVVVAPHLTRDYAALGLSSEAIPNGVEFPTENPFAGNIQQRRTQLLRSAPLSPRGSFGSLSNIDRRWILIPGRLQKSKGQERVIDLIESLPLELVESCQFIFLGAASDETERTHLESRALHSIHHERICYVGFQPDPLRWMSSADAVISLSDFEGLPLVALEARGLGLPALLSDIDAHRPLAAEAVRLTPLGEVSTAQQWLADLLGNRLPPPAQAWDRQAEFRQKHSLAQMTHDYLRAYEGPK